MKRILMTALFTLFSLNTFAQTETYTGIAISPSWPSSCNPHENKAILNTVYEIERVAETADDVVYSLKTQFVQCNNGRLVPYMLVNPAIDIDRKGLFAQLGPRNVESVLELYGNTELKVTFTFNKRKIFKRASKKEERFEMLFLPYNVNFYNQITFWWNIVLIKDMIRNVVRMEFARN
jgi:hypothetical protein